MTAPVLEARDLSISFGGLRAVDGVSFAAARNRITTIIGPNGAGKSTLFNLISGALRPQSGAVFVEGVECTGAPPDRMLAAGVARSFQITNLLFDLPVAENLRLAAQVLERPAASRAPVWPSCWSVSASPARRGLRSRSSPTASSAASKWRWRSPAGPRC
jgi:branched-chain amino acid transport system ATP-binding protein